MKKIKASVVPRMHVLNHVRSCKLKYDPRNTEHAGLLDYEGIERVWAPFRYLFINNFKLK